MKKSIAVTLGSIAAAFVVNTSAGELPTDLGERLVTGYIAPATQRFADAAEMLTARLQTWCEEPDTVGRAAIERDFGALVESWSGIEFLRFGPLVAANRFERIFFWPDARGVMLRQVQALLKQPDVAGDARLLAGRSVAVQGLPALEYMLYRDGGLLAATRGASSSGEFATECAYAQASAHNLAERGKELAAAWHGDYAALFARPGPANPVYRSSREVANEAVKAISTSLQFLRDVKLAPVLGNGPDASRARRAPFWRSGLTTRSLHAQVHGLLAFYEAGGWRYYPPQAWINESLTLELDGAQSMLAELSAPVAELLSDPEHYRRLQLVGQILANVKRIVDEYLAPAFGVTIGFNALDGD